LKRKKKRRNESPKKKETWGRTDVPRGAGGGVSNRVGRKNGKSKQAEHKPGPPAAKRVTRREKTAVVTNLGQRRIETP